MNSTDLLSFKSISDFIKQLSEGFTNKNYHSLKLYEHLLNKTTLSHEKVIKKHIELFRDFCIANRDSINNKDSKLLKQSKIEYSSRVYIDFDSIFKDSDKETSNVIWSHILTISALLDPAGKAKEILKNNKDSKEANFLSDIINKVESNVNPGASPLEAMTSMMSSGIFNDLLSGMNNGVQNGELDLGKLMNTVQTMCSSLSNNTELNNKENPMNMVNTLLSSMPKGDGAEGMPDLSAILGPMLSSLNVKDNTSNLPSINEINETLE